MVADHQGRRHQGGVSSLMVSLMAAWGQVRRCRPYPPTVRCSTDSGHIAAIRELAKRGHELPCYLGSPTCFSISPQPANRKLASGSLTREHEEERMRRLATSTLSAIAGFAITVAPGPSTAQSHMTKDQLVGSWQITSFKATAGNQVIYPLGEHPGGYWGFSQNRFWVLLIDSTRKAPAAAAFTDTEAVALMKTHAAYTGKYDADPAETPDGIKITVHVDASSTQALTGTERVFFMRVNGSKLTVKSPSLLIPMSGQTLTGILQLEFARTD
jgi:hypothetical protein